MGRERRRHRLNLGPARHRPRPRDDRDVIKHDRRVLDEDRVGKIRRIRQPCHPAAETSQRRFVLLVLRNRTSVVNRLTHQVRKLAPTDTWRNGAG